MLIFPAIALLEGRCVRLRQGRFDEATVYSDDPLGVAQYFAEQGAEALHVVDLDGARLGKAKNLDWIYRIREAVSIPLQVGGGIRTYALARRLLSAGIERIVLGTAAAEDPRLLVRLLESHAIDRAAAALDLRGDRLAVKGWESESARNPDELLDTLKTVGVRWVVCTDVTRDGLLIGPGLKLARRVIREGFLVILAGGVATVDDVIRIRETGAAGCIIGSALYGGLLSLPDAIEAARAV
ncbi:MAG: 1-(5-phosphoribosyl)-5-[(5-phosphoribosylamino)methylideneamino] imidazole-4-carboxamide isomerase [Gemmatimonadota bacterium]|nr:MAG: 1-(5-phosphoribosyl)-5-[(5-phosphoribosylamino)methylideneamino] imidazole-4-carboxamide isomerase [Gemmatimonadota bacterium]